MDSKRVAQATAKVLQSYLTYQAVLTIIDQMSETNPGQAIWLREYSTGNKLQDGEAYLEGLMAERKDLVLRILTVRADIAENIMDFLPEMVNSNVQQSNIAHRRRLLERLTQSAEPTSIVDLPTSEGSQTDSD